MKFDFESLSTEPLFYMLMHSGAFVCVLGFIFFVVGLLFGYATWGRYKRQARQLRGEADAMKDEIASLKRKVGDHSILSGPTIPMATETIHMPKKEGTTAAEAVPVVTAETITTRDIRLPATPPAPAAPAPAEAPAPAAASLPPSAAELPQPAPHASPLAAIIAAPPVKAEPEPEAATPAAPAAQAPAAPAAQAPAALLPALTDLLLPALPELELQPELHPKLEPELETDTDLDPKLGLIYKNRPANADDLTALEGISLVLAQRLHDIGIYTYAQIAAWDEDHVKEFSARLAFKDRIYRERWVEQARKLVAKPAAV